MDFGEAKVTVPDRKEIAKPAKVPERKEVGKIAIVPAKKEEKP